jgi:hypothetical protein
MTIRLHRSLTGLVLAALLLTACSGPTRTAPGPALTPPESRSQTAPPAPVAAPVAADPAGEGQPAVAPPSSTGALTARPEYTPAVAARDVNAPTTARRDPAAMTVDLVVARPAGAVATVAGAAIFLVSWPFAALGGNTDATWDSLVADPAAYTFQRPLGDFDHERPRQPPAAP